MILGTASWDAPIATNQHYVARELSRNFDVIFIEGVGTRSLKLQTSDLKRVFRRLIHRPSIKSRRAVPERVRIISMILAPIHSRTFSLLNSVLMSAQLRRYVKAAENVVVWTFTPYEYGASRATRGPIIYHLVDLIFENPGVNKRWFLAQESKLAKKTFAAIGTSPAIAKHLEAQGFRNILLRTNVADIAVFSAWRNSPPCRERTVIFAGMLTAVKLDFALLRAVAGTARENDGELICIGPVDRQHTSEADLAELKKAGVKLIEACSAVDLAEHLARAAVGIIPYRINPLTVGISPLKVNEYLASGLAVVSTALPSLDQGTDHIVVTHTTSEFCLAVKRSLNGEFERHAINRSMATAGQSWEHRGAEYRSLARKALTRW